MGQSTPHRSLVPLVHFQLYLHLQLGVHNHKLNTTDTTGLSLCLCRIRNQLYSHLLSPTAGLQVVESNVFGALLQTAL